jgi:hypothetical protein
MSQKSITQYRLSNVVKVRQWHINGDTIPHPGDDGDEHGRAKRVFDVYSQENRAKLSLACHVDLFGSIPDLVKDLSEFRI